MIGGEGGGVYFIHFVKQQNRNARNVSIFSKGVSRVFWKPNNDKCVIKLVSFLSQLPVRWVPGLPQE
jgi:hypothetical protein